MHCWFVAERLKLKQSLLFDDLSIQIYYILGTLENCWEVSSLNRHFILTLIAAWSASGKFDHLELVIISLHDYILFCSSKLIVVLWYEMVRGTWLTRLFCFVKTYNSPWEELVKQSCVTNLLLHKLVVCFLKPWPKKNRIIFMAHSF